MDPAIEFIARAFAIGLLATALLDLWNEFLRRVLGVRSANWAMVGRWIGNFADGRFAHADIVRAPRVLGELAIGWTAHYAIGSIYAFLLLSVFGLQWARDPTPGPALAVGIGTVVAPFFIMQPCMGDGIAASRTQDPNRIRLRSLLAHTVFGVGLYVSALLTAIVWPG